MKPAPFTLHRPVELAEALLLLRDLPDAQPLAGGQSLVPLLNLRLARPEHVVDIGGIAELGGIELAAGGENVEAGGGLAIGAAVTQSDALASGEVAARVPLLAEALGHVAHQPIRNRGTVVGSIAHADPSAELPAVALALDAVVELASLSVGSAGRGLVRREVPATELFVGPFETVRQPHELITKVTFRCPGTTSDAETTTASGWGFAELAKREGDFALVLAAVMLEADADGTVSRARIALGGAASTAVRATDAEQSLVGLRVLDGAGDGQLANGSSAGSTGGAAKGDGAHRDSGGLDAAVEAALDGFAVEAALDDAAATAGTECRPRDDLGGSAEYRRRLVRVLVGRALRDAVGRLRAGGSDGAASSPSASTTTATTTAPSAAAPTLNSGTAPGEDGATDPGTASDEHPQAGAGTVTVNGEPRPLKGAEDRLLLADWLRDGLNLTGTHLGCEHGVCGACTVLVDGELVRSCLMLAHQAEGRQVTTIESLGTPAELHPIQQAFTDSHGLQCGFCTPAMVLTAHRLLGDNPSPTEAEIREAISANVCRCTGYVGVVEAVKLAANRLSTNTEDG